jgi:hypothetical protein
MSDLNNLYEPRVSVATFNDIEPIKECVDVMPRVFNTYLIDELGMTSKRACKIGKAVENLWEEAIYLDLENRHAIMDLTIAEILDLYGEQEGAYSSFNEAQRRYKKELLRND